MGYMSEVRFCDQNVVITVFLLYFKRGPFCEVGGVKLKAKSIELKIEEKAK